MLAFGSNSGGTQFPFSFWGCDGFPLLICSVLFELFEFDFFFVMFSSSSAAVSVQPVQKTGKDLMEPRLLSMFINAGVSARTNEQNMEIFCATQQYVS